MVVGLSKCPSTSACFYYTGIFEILEKHSDGDFFANGSITRLLLAQADCMY